MSQRALQLPPRGAYCELAELIGLRLLGSQLDLGRRKRALNQLTGPNKSSFRGRGIDFEEVRGYQAGDDIRSIDWRVTARTGSAHTKLFREERERPVLIAVDQRNSLFFGSRHCFKSVLAAHLASLLAWSALDKGDRVGALLFNGVEHREIRPRRSRRNVLAILSALADYNHRLPLQASASGGSFSDMLGHLRRVARPGSSIYLISDFHNATRDGASEHLYQLARHCEITALACHDPLELNLPRAGVYAVTDGEQTVQLSTGDRHLRREYTKRALTEAEQWSLELQRLGIPLLAFSTTRAPFPVLQNYYVAGKH
ncbi:DUF58 domain-containing protein [Parahaliea aestuarii]|uniref:DUF58 domain-containing protein n=1 Tax=Parahaliea aestuarii TaxID=1852021 RepID=A0A5C8ZXX2_9GAMM|nr:DUF58 domain-containing protein [Parahaliea aestuarii]TXS93336.1 DUF58 domain-containing protein [Parahaliea aestuarii]